VITAIEGVAQNIIELAPLLEQQWEELGEYKDRMPLVPDFAIYIVRESQGQCFMATIRDGDGGLCGYYICMVNPLPHHMTTLSACMDYMYVDQACRRDGNGQLLLTAVENELRRRGVKMWLSVSRASGPSHDGMDKLLRKNGFAPLDLIYAKWIGP
jgi:GNAT superfamily N-acetyltransferase